MTNAQVAVCVALGGIVLLGVGWFGVAVVTASAALRADDPGAADRDPVDAHAEQAALDPDSELVREAEAYLRSVTPTPVRLAAPKVVPTDAELREVKQRWRAAQHDTAVAARRGGYRQSPRVWGRWTTGPVLPGMAIYPDRTRSEGRP